MIMNFFNNKHEAHSPPSSPIMNWEAETLEHLECVIARTLKPESIGASNPFRDALLRLNGMIARIDETILEENVGFSICASESMAGTARLTGDVRETDHRIQGLASGMVEMVSSIDEIASNCTNTADLVSRVSGDIGRTTDITLNAANDTRAVSTQFDHMRASISEVQEATAQIAAFVSTVEAIARQTSLLALNATIEAARAGEAGRGFSVVASEVKTLSGQTSKATDDIKARITKLLHNVDALTDTVSGVSDTVGRSVESVLSVSQQLDQVQGDIRVADGYVREISHILRQQHAAVSEMTEQIQDISDVAKRSAGNLDDVIGAVSGSEGLVAEAFKRLEGRNIPNYVLHRSKSDHALWKKHLSEMLVGMNTLKADELTNHTHCRLGKWYNNVNDQALKSLPEFKAIAKPHELVHTHGIAAAKAHQQGNRQLALEEITKMEAASREVIEHLDNLIAQRQ